MGKRRIQAVLFATLMIVVAAVALGSANAGHAIDRASNLTGLAYVGSDPALPNTVSQASTQALAQAPAQAAATQEPLLTEVLPPVVSQPVPTGRGLFDEITDRLLRALLNFF